MLRGWTGRAQRVLAFAVAAGLVAAALAADPARAQQPLRVRVDNIKQGRVIPAAFAYCVPAARGHTRPGPNRSPAISWSKGPGKTASYAIIIVDTDVPIVFDDANKEGKTISRSTQRRPYYHWVLVDIPPAVTALAESADTSEPSPKKPGPTKHGVRGINDYSGGGQNFGGYDGPCPPWNDELLHHYHFGVYALDVGKLGVSGNFTGPDALRAMQGHVVAKGEMVGVYSQNPDVMKALPK